MTRFATDTSRVINTSDSECHHISQPPKFLMSGNSSAHLPASSISVVSGNPSAPVPASPISDVRQLQRTSPCLTHP
ncbi:hypothetical protein JTE90_019933 [Oedothorax gibbosus]|uniref:Uncharacterized protein n=1 Tax=Oedothorax gibbosus TaxID=931172 RepID=A0AAV6UQM8_9ARAC|nr:hypothetical protein JTE90_019933 [Oedothorax gibbosus]